MKPFDLETEMIRKNERRLMLFYVVCFTLGAVVALIEWMMKT